MFFTKLRSSIVGPFVKRKMDIYTFFYFPHLFILSLGPSYNNCQSRKTLDFITSQLLPDIGKGGSEGQE